MKCVHLKTVFGKVVDLNFATNEDSDFSYSASLTFAPWEVTDVVVV
jgi:hypothetical protein